MPSAKETRDLQEEQLREHDELLQLLDELRELFGQAQVPGRELAARLENLALVLSSHFSFEETQGLFRRITLAFPRLENRARSLEAEHTQLRGKLQHLVDETRRGPAPAGSWQQMAAQFVTFREMLLAHERGEHELLQQAYDQDLGAPD